MGLENVYSVFCTFELHQEFLVIPHTLAGWQLKPYPKKLSVGHPSQVTGCGSPQAMDNHCAINYCSTLQRLIMILVPGDFSSLGSPHLGDSLPPVLWLQDALKVFQPGLKRISQLIGGWAIGSSSSRIWYIWLKKVKQNMWNHQPVSSHWWYIPLSPHVNCLLKPTNFA